MKTKLIFDSEVEGDDELLSCALMGVKYKDTLDSIWNDVFRPHRKHGYGNEILDSEAAYPVIEELIERYQRLLEELE